MASPTKEFREFTAYTIIFYFLPVLLLATGFIPFVFVNLVLVLVGLILVAYAITKPISLRDLGFRKDNLAESLLYSVAITVLGLIVLCFLWGIGAFKSVYGQNSVLFYIFYILISAPLQEFVFRGLMFYELGIFFKDRSGFWKVLISALIYSFSHAGYKSWSIIIITTLIGLVWGFMYLKKPNLWGVAISHMILGAATVALGIL